MYSFSLENQFNKEFAVIEYEEEYSFNNLYEKDIFFIKTIWEWYYDDYIFSIEELKKAKLDLMKYMELDRWENLSDEVTKNQLKLIYKLIAIVFYALENNCSLYGSGD